LIDLREVRFIPHKWGQIRKFILFHSPTYQFSQSVDSALSGAEGHFGRYIVLRGLCKKLIPELAKDYEELVQKGHSRMIHSQELAAIVDSLFCELYSRLIVLGLLLQLYIINTIMYPLIRLQNCSNMRAKIKWMRECQSKLEKH
jgi:hypothetical protein